MSINGTAKIQRAVTGEKIKLSPWEKDIKAQAEASKKAQEKAAKAASDLEAEIANTTGGKYFRATSNTKLEEIYEEINKLEKTEIEETKYTSYDELFRPFVLLAFSLLFFELFLRYSVFRSFI